MLLSMVVLVKSSPFYTMGSLKLFSYMYSYVSTFYELTCKYSSVSVNDLRNEINNFLNVYAWLHLYSI